MKILQLNVWTGRIKGALKDFFKDNDFDVICLQEAVWGNDLASNLFTTVEQIQELTGLKHVVYSSNWGLNIFKSGKVLEQGNVILCRDEIVAEKNITAHGEYKIVNSDDDFYNHAYTAQSITLKNGLTIINHHGYWQPNPIGNETTVEAMQKVADLIHEATGPVVMCGDLNIIHDSPAMRALDFLHDLTHEYNVDNTLSGLKFNGKVACDHILVSNDITVKNFQVLDNLISDHKALTAEITVAS